ncbi:MAG: HlyD family efflux transporter periplasmic adaptor subunit [Spirochaetales bacterium]|nr:HlyD family efflux transporter periplasmic adaptor subunit [Spirochaetales bacterium]
MKTKDALTTLYSCLSDLQKLRNFHGSNTRFWNMYLGLLISLSDAEGGVITAANTIQPDVLHVVAFSRAASIISADRKKLSEEIVGLVHDQLKDGIAWIDHAEHLICAVRLDTGVSTDYCLACFLFQAGGRIERNEIGGRLMLASDIPAGLQLQRTAMDAKIRVEQLSNVLDLMALMNEKKRFLPSAMTFCNEIASRLKCERVSIGWFEKGYIRLKAMSHVDRFDKKAEIVRKLEEAQEECIDQNAEVTWPAEGGGGAVNRAHMSFSQANDVAHICSMPLRLDNEAVAVCSCERNTSPFTETELRLLRLCCDQVSRRLSDLKSKDRWFGFRFVDFLREKLGKIIGYTHTWIKILGIVIAIAVGILVFGKLEYKISAPVILRTDNITYLTAPFDGHIDKVKVRVGDAVEKGDALLLLDQSDLRLQEAGIIAERNRYRREVEKARAANSLADMRISQALLEQSDARLELVQYQLNQSILIAPFDGIIVEGDQMERIGSPIKQGEILFKLARVDQLYSELKVDEADIHEVHESQKGEIILASRPKDVFPVIVGRIEPLAIPEEKGNIFIVRCTFPEGRKEWWRPGMTGIAKINGGERNILWIITHRTIDFLRMHLWF